MERVLIVEGAGDLDRLIADPGGFDAVRLRHPALTEAEAARLGRRFTAWAQECGCGEGGLAVLLALMVAAPVGGGLWAQGLATAPLLAGAVLAVIVPAALAAKGLVVWRARQALQREAVRLRARIVARPADTG